MIIRGILILLIIASIFSSVRVEAKSSATQEQDSVAIDSNFVELSILESLASPDELSGATVTVRKDNRIDISKREKSNINGYRIRIFFDNSQKARTKSNEAKVKFTELFSDIPVYVEYSAPYFKVSVGDYMTREEALVALQKIVEEFPKSFIANETIPLSKFMKKE